MAKVDFISAAFFVGLALSIMSGSELVLREQQKQRFQEAMETFTLWIDDVRPIRQFAMLEPLAMRAVLCLFSSLLLLWFFIWLFLRGYFNHFSELQYVTVLIASLIENALFNYFVGARIMKRIFNSSKPITLMAGFCGIALVAALFLLTSLSYTVHASNNDTVNIVYILVISLAATAIMLVSIISILDFAYRFLLYLSLLCKIVTMICWRLVEYSKGAFAALVILLTAALGIAKVVFGIA